MTHIVVSDSGNYTARFFPPRPGARKLQKAALYPHSAGLLLGHHKLVSEPQGERLRALRRRPRRTDRPVRTQRGRSLARGQLEIQPKEHRHRARGLWEPSVDGSDVPFLGEAFGVPLQALRHTRTASSTDLAVLLRTPFADETRRTTLPRFDE